MSYTEKKIRKLLKELNDNWNDKYWLFSTNATLHLMKYEKNGEPLITNHGGVDERNVVDTFNNIKNDGGDW